MLLLKVHMRDLRYALMLILAIFISASGHTENVGECAQIVTNPFQFTKQSLGDRFIQIFKREASVRKSMIHTSRPELIEDWMHRFHGLKVSLMNAADQLTGFNVYGFYYDIQKNVHEGRPEFQDLLDSLNAMTESEQRELVLQLKDQARYHFGWVREVGAGEILLEAAREARSTGAGLLESYRSLSARVHAQTLAKFKTEYPPLYTELAEAMASGKIRLDKDGTVTCDQDGLPDRYTYGLALKLDRYHSTITGKFRGNWGEFLLLSPEHQRMAKALFEAPSLTLRRALTDPHNQHLEKIRYTELIGSGEPAESTLWHFIDSSHGGSIYRGVGQRRNGWWAPLTDFDQPTTKAKNPSRITAETTMDHAVRDMYGPDLERIPFWPRATWRKGMPFTPDLSRIRIIENRNRSTGELYSVQVLANYKAGEPPLGFFLVNVGGDLIPVKTFDGKPIEQACIRCHVDKDGKMSFKPKMFTSEQAVIDIGFHDREVVKMLMTGR